MSAVLKFPADRRGRVFDGRERFTLFPRGYKAQGWWLYAIGLPDGRLKVGMASHPRPRMSQHWRTHGGLAWAHLFACKYATSLDAMRAERACIKACEAVANRIGRTECFTGADPKTFIAACRDGIAQHAAESAAKRARAA